MRSRPWFLVALTSLMAAVANAGVLEDLGYVPTYNVDNQLLLALDLKQMRIAHNEFNLKKSIYESGSTENTGSLNLQGLSTSAALNWDDFPMYSIYRAGFDLLGQVVEGDDPGYFDGKPIDRYADTLVKDLFLLNVTNIEAEAALAVNIYMAFVGSLYEMLAGCKENDQEAMNGGLDRAAAYWVGEQQVRGDSSTGYLFYNLAQFVGERFNQFANDDSEVIVNTNMISAFLLLQGDIASNQCVNDNGFVQMRSMVHTMISYANQVLMQMLLHRTKTYTDGQPTDFVELYSLALLPQVAACDSDLFNTILKYTVNLNVDETTEQTLIESLQKAYNCLGLTCEQVGAYMVNLIPQCSEDEIPALAGYEPIVDVRVKSRIDRDIRQMRWLMQFSAYDAAMDLYKYGYHSDFSLQQLVMGETVDSVGSVYQKIASYYADSTDRDFMDIAIRDILDQGGIFATASDEQLQAYMDSMLRGIVMFLGVTNELEAAVDLAEGGDFAGAQAKWDAGAALYIGSTEGPHIGGADRSPGESIYGLAKDMCRDFHVCDSNGDSLVNQVIFDALDAGSTAIQSSDMLSLEAAWTNSIKPNLIVPSIQGMLDSVVEAGLDPSGADVGFANGYSKAVLGFFSEDAVQVSNIRNAITPNPTPQAAEVVFTSMEDILDLSPTDCSSVGDIRASDNVPRNVCKGVPANAPLLPDETEPPNFVPAPTPAPVPITRAPAAAKPVPQEDPSGVAWGRYQFKGSSAAQNDAAVALDVKSMWIASDLDASEQIYVQGQNFQQGLYGMPTITTLAEMSTKASDIMANDVIFNFYRYAVYADELFTTSVDEVWDFGNDVVTLALSPDKGNSPVLAAESAVVLISMQIILRQLYESMRQCKASNQNEAMNYVDSAVSIWIGKEQGDSLFNSGYMMYSQAQLAWSNLGENVGEAPANTKLMGIFNDIQTAVNGCTSDGSGSAERIRMLIKDVNKQLSVSLIQNLLYYLAVGDKNFEELFSVAVVPQLAACSRGDYDALKNKLFNAGFFQSSQDDQDLVLEELAAGLACLEITCDDMGDAANSGQEKLTKIFSTMCKDLSVLSNATYLAGYETDNPVADISRLDLDIHQIDVLMRTEAIEAAQEIYEKGYNSRDGATFRSLKGTLADAIENGGEDSFAFLFNDYFINDNYADQFLTALFTGTGAYQSASRAQKAEAAKRMLQTAVTYLSIDSLVDQALATCENDEEGEMFVDQGAALFVGSIEGTRSGGSKTNSGAMLMALGKEVCEAFDKCESNDDSTANEFILFAFQDMKQWLTTKNCDSAASIKDESLMPMLSVSIIQATLWFASMSESLSAASDDSKLAALDVFAKTILPEVSDVNATSAATINDNTEFNSQTVPVSSGTTALFEAFTYVVRGMGVDCDVVGTLQSLTLSTCDSEIVAPHPNTPTTLGKNTSIYKSTTFVDNLAGIALDVKEMEDDLVLDRKDLAELIYKEGQNSPVYDKFGIKTDTRSLSAFSTNATNTMKQNPLYQTTVYALQDESNEYLGRPATQYADSVVQEAFGKGGTLAAEAAVVLNLWMETANELYKALENCKNQQVHDDEGIHQIDKVAAYWIGDGETAGNEEEGHLLYNLAERMAIKFDTLDESGQATTNLKLLRSLNQARLDLSFPQSCSEDLTTARKLQRTVTKVVAQMVTVQIQGLINGILTNDRNRVRIFAHGFVPLVKACSENTFSFLNQKLIPADYAETEIDAIIGRIYSTLSCFEISCDDIGYHQEAETGAECEDSVFMAPLAGYRPSVDIAEYATLDLDINLIEILMKQKAYGVAKDVYMFGKHSASGTTAFSLQSLAKSTRRSSVPEYNTFVQYYSGDNNYADTMVMEAFDSPDMEAYKREAIVVGGSKFLIMYMGILEAMYESVRECKQDNRQQVAQLLWNKAAAYIIGSIEGPVDEPYSKRQGTFLWGVAKEHCNEWGTCRNFITGSTAVNEKIRDLLYTGRGAVGASSCQALEKASSEIGPLLRATLIQNSLEAIIETSRHRDGPIRDIHHAQAFVATESFLPLINIDSRDTAALIKSSLDFDGPSLPNGAVPVAKGITDSMSALGVSCDYVGGTAQVNSCTGEVTDDKNKNLPLILGLLAGLLVGGAVAVALFLWHNKKRSDTPEQPKFVRNTKGVMDEGNVEFDPANSRGAAAMDEMEEADASNAAKEEFLDVELPEPV